MSFRSPEERVWHLNGPGPGDVRNSAAARRRFRRKSGRREWLGDNQVPFAQSGPLKLLSCRRYTSLRGGMGEGRRRVESDRRGSRGQDADKAALPRGDKSVRGMWVVWCTCANRRTCARWAARSFQFTGFFFAQSCLTCQLERFLLTKLCRVC